MIIDWIFTWATKVDESARESTRVDESARESTRVDESARESTRVDESARGSMRVDESARGSMRVHIMVGILLQNSTLYICIQLQPRIIIFNNNNYIHIQQ
jgi:hypothetical protein